MVVLLFIPSITVIKFPRLENRKESDVLKVFREMGPRYLTPATTGFNLNAPTCAEKLMGTVSKEEIEDTITQVNFFRYLVGLNAHPVIQSPNQTIFEEQIQCAATHYIQDSTMDRGKALLYIRQNPLGLKFACATEAAERGCLNSNIEGWKVTVPRGNVGEEMSFLTGAVGVNYMIQNRYTANANYRRWLLYPPLYHVSYAMAPFFFALRVTDLPQLNDTNLDVPFVAYPPPGPMPKHLIFPQFTFSLPRNALADAKLMNTTIAADNNSAQTIPSVLYVNTPNSTNGDSTIGFTVNSQQLNRIKDAKEVHVVVTIKKDDNFTVFEYTVKPFDAQTNKVCIHNIPNKAPCPWEFSSYLTPYANVDKMTDADHVTWTRDEILAAIPTKTHVNNAVIDDSEEEPEVFLAGFFSQQNVDAAINSSDLFKKPASFYGASTMDGKSLTKMAVAADGQYQAHGKTKLTRIEFYPASNQTGGPATNLQPDIVEFDLIAATAFFGKTAIDYPNFMLYPRKTIVNGQGRVKKVVLGKNNVTVIYDDSTSFVVPVNPVENGTKTGTGAFELDISGSAVEVEVADGVTSIPPIMIAFTDPNIPGTVTKGGNWSGVENQGDLTIEEAKVRPPNPENPYTPIPAENPGTPIPTENLEPSYTDSKGDNQIVGNQDQNRNSKAIPMGLIVGIAVGVVVVIAVIVIVAVAVAKKRHQNKDDDDFESGEVSDNAIITNTQSYNPAVGNHENPLWEMEQLDDDPFKKDFQEETEKVITILANNSQKQ